MTPLQATILFWVQIVFYAACASAMIYLPVSTWRRDRELRARIAAADAQMEAMRGRLEADFKEHLEQRWRCPQCGTRLEPGDLAALKPGAQA